MPDSEITIEQMRAERDTARQELERVKADLQALQQWWDMNPSLLQHELKGARQEADQNAALVGELKRCLGRMESLASAWVTAEHCTVGDGISPGAEEKAQKAYQQFSSAINAAIYMSEPAALEHVQREAAAKALEEAAEDYIHEYMAGVEYMEIGNRPWTCTQNLRNERDCIKCELLNRAAELREGK